MSRNYETADKFLSASGRDYVDLGSMNNPR